MKKIHFMIVDDQQIIREGLEGMLGDDESLELVGVAENGLQAVKIASERKPDLILMDLRMPVMSGAEAIQKIHKISPETRFIVLTVYDNDEELLKALRAGAKAFLLKDVSRDELIAVMKSVAEGKAHFQPELTSRMLDRLADLSGENEQVVHITGREMAILQHMAQGYSNKEIGRAIASK